MAVKRQLQHKMLPIGSHDEDARQGFVQNFRLILGRDIAPANKTVWEKSVGPAFVKEHGREPETSEEVQEVMTKDRRYQIWSAMQRNSQELMWDSVIDSVERQLPDLIEKAKPTNAPAGGSLTLDPDLATPHYLTDHDIHLQPGCYQANYTDGDVAAGAVYDRGGFVYSMGYIGVKSDFTGTSNLHLFKILFPDAKPKRVLDMGCAMGNSTLPWAEEFPDAEVYGVDVGPALLRYGHARAEDLGVKIHFSQQNVEQTDFEDGSFDAVVSHWLMHETNHHAVPKIFAESRRLLKPGGIMMHFDLPRFCDMEPVNAFLASWEARNVAEDFAADYRVMDIVGEAQKAGWQDGEVSIEGAESYPPYKVGNYVAAFIAWPVLVGVKGDR